MPNIALIDDRKEARETIKINLDLALNKDWTSIDIYPLKNIDDYPSWITENDVAAILLDERLQEKVDLNSKNITYSGHDLVDYLRKKFTTLPIFIVTTYPKDNEIIERFKDVEDIIEREEFNKNYDNYVPRILRSAQKFLETFEKELFELSQIASDIAIGESDPAQIEKLKAIQTKIGIMFPSDTFIERSELLNNCENVLEELNKLKDRLDNDLESES